MQSEGVNADGGRPQQHVRPPAYLEDYDLTAARRRQVGQPMMPHAAEEPQRRYSSEAAGFSSSPSDKASSPVSQYSWNVVDEWSPAAFNMEHYYDRRQVGLPTQSSTPAPPNHPSLSSPYHRPWEKNEIQSPPPTVGNIPHQPYQPILHSGSLPTPLPPLSTSRQPLQMTSETSGCSSEIRAVSPERGL